MQKSWHLGRRTFLRGAGGVALSLPFLDCMAAGAGKKAAAELPRRLCCVYFPFGVATPDPSGPDGQWHWLPKGEGKNFELSSTLRGLQPVQDDVTILGGMSHPAGRRLGGHRTGNTFLTGAGLLDGQYRNTISIDQYAAAYLGAKTRISSLILSSDGGVGDASRSATLSFSDKGSPIPALSSPQKIFDRLFGTGGSSEKTERAKLKNASSMLDLVREHSRSLKRQLGQKDRTKLDEYLASVREVEQRVKRSQHWLSVPKPKVDPKSVGLSASPNGPKDYIKAMYDLMFLAFQTDTTRLANYMIGRMASGSIANAFPACIGLGGNWHGLAHGARRGGGAERLGKFIQFLTDNHGEFLTRLKKTPEGDGSMLDRTMVFYGTSNSRTHVNRNYPLVLAGGSKLGLRQGRYHKIGEKMPLSNVFVTMLDRLKVPVKSFADSTGECSELIT